MVDPNIVYLVLIAGLWLLVTAIHLPGTGALEGLAVIALIGAIVLMASAPTNWAMAVIIVIGTLSALVIPFAGRQYAALAIVGLVVGSIAGYWLINGQPVSPALILLVTGGGIAFQRFALLPALDRQKHHPVMLDDQPIIGQRGYVQRTLTPVGTVFVRGETWTARTAERHEQIESGAEVVVIDREGLTLTVESVKQKRARESASETASDSTSIES